MPKESSVYWVWVVWHLVNYEEEKQERKKKKTIQLETMCTQILSARFEGPTLLSGDLPK